MSTLRVRHLELDSGEVIRLYRDPELEREHRNWHYGRSADYDRLHGQMRPMAAPKPGDDDATAAEHLDHCGHCRNSEQVIVVGGDSDGVWQRVNGEWERM